MSAATDKLDALIDELELAGLELINESAAIADIKAEEAARKHGH